MTGAHVFLEALAIVLTVAAITTVLFQRLHQPVVLGYILAGLIVGPHVPIPLVADRAVIHTLSELGVILVMFSLGLEFHLRKLARLGPRVGLIGLLETSIMFWLGLVIGEAFGWTGLERAFIAAALAISSTTIIARAFEEQRVRGRLREVVLGVLIVEDLIAILMIGALTAVATTGELSAGELARSAGRLGAFVVALLAVGLFVVPPSIRAIHRLRQSETLLVASIGICFLVALVAAELGYSVALGAFLAGSLVAESGEEEAVARLVAPVRDVFAAIFFVSVGMSIDPLVVLDYAGPVAVLVAVVAVGKVASVSLGAFLAGYGVRTSLQSGMSLAQIGEFSFIIAGLGVSLGATRDFIYPAVVAVSAVTTLATPWLIRGSGPAASFLDRKLPRALQTYAALYGSWVERLRGAPRAPSQQTGVRRLARLLALDAVLLAAVAISAAVYAGPAAEILRDRLGASDLVARALVLAAVAALVVPLLVGVFSISARVAALLADAAFPRVGAANFDRAVAPRRALVLTLQAAMVLLVGLPLLALTQPFLSGAEGPVVLALVLASLGIAFWRNASELQGHVKAGAEVILEALARQARGGAPLSPERELDRVTALIPGLGEPVPVRLDARSGAIGRTLADIDLRGQTGATVLAIARGRGGVIVPSARDVLEAGDVLALAGTHEDVAAARALLLAPPAGPGYPRDVPRGGVE